MKCIRIGYYNVTFDLIVKAENDIFVIEHLTRQIDEGKIFQMQDISRWCDSHNIDFKTSFSYRKEIPLKANLWNLYSYLRFSLTKNR